MEILPEPSVRPVFFVSDNTGITAETLGNALLAQFPGIDYQRHHLPFVDSVAAARRAVVRIAAEGGDRSAAGAGHSTGAADAAEDEDAPGVPDFPGAAPEGAGGVSAPAPLVFLTVRDAAVAAELDNAPGEVIDLLGTHLTRLEHVLGTTRTGAATAYHRVGDLARYHDRIDAVEYSIIHDDAASLSHIDRADVILVAPSRCGKTPTAMYLALQYGLRVANYPLTDDDRPGELPGALRPFRARLFGLTTTVQRLSQVRGERRPGSGYASPARCRAELRAAEQLYRTHRIPFLDTHAMSIEEISSIILTTMDLRHQ